MSKQLIEKNLHPQIDETIFGSSDKARSQQISRLEKAGKIRKIAPRIYTSNLLDEPEIIIKRNWYKILAHLFPGALLSHRSALEFKPSSSGEIFVTYKYTKTLVLPGLIVRLQKGHGPVDGDTFFFKELHVSQEARAFLENLEATRKTDNTPKTLSKTAVEDKLDAIIRIRGEEGLNTLRDEARIIAGKLGMNKEFEQLNKIVAALLSSNSKVVLSSSISKARLSGFPYDPVRIDLFAHLYEQLAVDEYPEFDDKNKTVHSYQNFAFYESYFSNYIEGTIFEIEEAKEIILTATPMPSRDEDSHDILGTYQIVSNRTEMSRVPETADELLTLLRYRHSILMSARPSKAPGNFKDKNNRAGSTEFVDWQLVAGTLKKGFELYSILRSSFARAAFMMFMVSEVHPFLDGNGRVARVMMNAELTSKGLSKIIIPTVYREDYMGALKKLTKQAEPASYIRMLLRAYEFSATVYSDDMNTMEAYLKKCDAFEEPTLGRLNYQKI
ncbi:Fic family protein [Mucilaginibacter flavidus]|uniref:Fic family protein n=1 Tax=Mucilaginibacter flavidus TaxID=2949309 RepID=UPI002093294F|nr:Fic family protein [Mucilaginibacter flavidus]MCO5945680.1 Fic family protein [Mucilaginibacter flavidus]